MEIIKKVTVELSADDVKEIIARYIRDSLPYADVDDVTIKVYNECRGYGMDEHLEACFKGATIVCTMK